MKIQGKAVSEGIAVGRLYIYEQGAAEKESNEGEWDSQKERYLAACASVKEDLTALIEKISQEGDERKGFGNIFEAHKAIVEDEAMNEEILDLLDEDTDAVQAVSEVYDAYTLLLGKTKDPMIRERTADLEDVKNRLLRAMKGIASSGLSCLPEKAVVAAKDLLPSDTADMDREHIIGIITEAGGTTSHSAIIARGYGIPSVSGIRMESLKQVENVIVDGKEGVVFTDPDRELIQKYEEEGIRFKREKQRTEEYFRADAVTTDGLRVPVKLNIEGMSAEVKNYVKFTDGVGLFRTEFLYMGKSELPSEEEQFQEYKRAVEAFDCKSVTVRTLDIGGDKKAECLKMASENNPFLGNRALRLCLGRPEIFVTQLKALLRAGCHGNLQVMFPMVSCVEDVRAAKHYWEKAIEELKTEGKPFNADIKLGVMIEIPAAALTAAEIAKEVDFASIGSNDLCQYTMAADRMNPDVNSYYRTFHPAMFRMIQMVIEGFHHEGKPVSVCGEMGGDVRAALALTGMGIDALSMSASNVAAVKRMLVSLNSKEAAEIARTVCHNSTEQQNLDLLEEYMRGYYD